MHNIHGLNSNDIQQAIYYQQRRRRDNLNRREWATKNKIKNLQIALNLNETEIIELAVYILYKHLEIRANQHNLEI